MYKLLAISTFAIACSASGTALAINNEDYVSGSLAFVNYSADNAKNSSPLRLLVGRLGTQLNENFSVEIKAGLGTGTESVATSGDPGPPETMPSRINPSRQYMATPRSNSGTAASRNANVELNRLVGAYIRGGAPLDHGIFPYAILGYTRVDLTLSGSGFSHTSATTDVSFGAGIDFDINRTFKINGEYTRYIDKGTTKIDGLAIGVVYRF